MLKSSNLFGEAHHFRYQRRPKQSLVSVISKFNNIFIAVSMWAVPVPFGLAVLFVASCFWSIHNQTLYRWWSLFLAQAGNTTGILRSPQLPNQLAPSNTNPIPINDAKNILPTMWVSAEFPNCSKYSATRCVHPLSLFLSPDALYGWHGNPPVRHRIVLYK